MKGSNHDHARQVLREAFIAGWQAALARNITSPAVLAVVESCFDTWLEEAADAAEVFGLVFRGREDLPGPSRPVTEHLLVPLVPEQASLPPDISELRRRINAG